MENKETIKLNVKFSESENNLNCISEFEQILYKIIEKYLNKVNIEYLMNNIIYFGKYNFEIHYNIFNKSLQFHSYSNERYLSNIRNIILKNDIETLFIDIIDNLENYYNNYLNFISNTEKFNLSLIKDFL